MARKAANKQAAGSTGAAGNPEVEASVIALAEQLGTFLGQVRAKADGWLDNDVLREQATQIREGAGELLTRLNRAGTAAKKSMAKVVNTTRAAAAEAEQAPRPSRGPVDAPGKKHRKPPPSQKVQGHMTDPATKRAGRMDVYSAKVRGRG